MPIGYPFLNGPRMDAGSIELRLNFKRYIGIKSIKYKQAVKPGTVYGALPQPLGFTRGTYDAVTGEIAFYREEFQDIITDLQVFAVGFLEAMFVGSVTYSELPPNAVPGNPAGASTDQILGMRFTGSDHSAEMGSSDPLVVTCEFMALVLFAGGKPPLNALARIVTAQTAL